MITAGRNPTLGEVLAYYSREDFLNFLLVLRQSYRVAIVIPEKKHWEIRWEDDEAKADTIHDLRVFIERRITQALPDVGLDERPPFYPAFHQTVRKAIARVDAQGNTMYVHIPDCIIEADLPTWHESFRDIGSILALLDEYGVPYRHKFSGHRSLHLIIPVEVLPAGYRGNGAKRLAKHLKTWGSLQAHVLSKITRMPYSLNEDTGLVCLPIARGTLSTFRPWQANLHLVDIQPDLCFELLTASHQAAMEAFVAAMQTQDPGILGSTFLVPDVEHILKAYQTRLDRFQDNAPPVWLQLVGAQALTEPDLLRTLEEASPDTCWLALEAYLLHGTHLTHQGMQALMAQDEEYVRASAFDVLVHFADDILPHLIEMLDNLHNYAGEGPRIAHLLAHNDSLRKKVFDALTSNTATSHTLRILSACLAGALAGNWTHADQLVAPLRQAKTLAPAHQRQLAALDLMRQMGHWQRKESARIARQIAALGPDVMILLLLAVGSPQQLFRRDVVIALSALDDVRAIDLLVQILADDDKAVRQKAVASLVRIGQPAIPALMEAAQSDQAPLRRQAILCLGNIGAKLDAPEPIRAIILEALTDSNAQTRRQALKSLQGIAKTNDIETITHILREAAWNNALVAVENLEKLGTEGRQAMQTLALAERNPAAAFGIARQGDPRGREILATWLAVDGPQRVQAVEFLRELGDDRSVPALAARLNAARGDAGISIALELARIGGEDAIRVLLDALTSKNPLTRRGAVRALATFKDSRFVEPFIRCLFEDDNFKNVRAASHALMDIGEAAKEPLREAMETHPIEDKPRRTLARRVLQHSKENFGQDEQDFQDK
ncbi:MAG: HEAT repeat domain-containing protein [Anaerolineae bacterium]|nr:HEAT repeat domain-containing protein [Anaerolineae bacterium]